MKNYNVKHKLLTTLGSVFFLGISTLMAQAESLSTMAASSPHFYIQMENQSNKNATMSFQQDLGSVTVNPILNNNTALSAHEISEKFGVVFDDLNPNDTFNIIFTGKQDCAFNVSFYAANNPKITISGLACYGGGYRMNGNTLVLYITDLH